MLRIIGFFSRLLGIDDGGYISQLLPIVLYAFHKNFLIKKVNKLAKTSRSDDVVLEDDTFIHIKQK